MYVIFFSSARFLYIFWYIWRCTPRRQVFRRKCVRVRDWSKLFSSLKLATLKFIKHNGLDESRFFLRPKTVEDWDGIISVRHLLQCTDSVQTVQCYDRSFVIQLLPPLEQQRLKHEMGKLFPKFSKKSNKNFPRRPPTLRNINKNYWKLTSWFRFWRKMALE